MGASSASSLPAVLQLLGHGLRWRVLGLLAVSDRRVNELVEMVDERQNLVSYHLGLLRRAGLVSERRSSADARDVYYSLALDKLEAALDISLAGLHPALRPGQRALVSVQPPAHRLRVLFLCTGNSARSLMAEAMLRQLSGGAVEVASAGLKPAGVHPLTLRVLRELEIPSEGLRSKDLGAVAGVVFDHVITLCDLAREECVAQPGDAEWSHWSLADPALVTASEAEALAAFRQVAADLLVRIKYLLPALLSNPIRAASAAARIG